MKKTPLFLTLLLASTLGLTACSGNKAKAVGANNATLSDTPAIVDGGLQKAAQSVSTSLSELAAVQKSLHPVAKQPFVTLQGQGLNRSVAISWDGPIAPLLRRVAGAIGYQLQVYGKAPVIPILVDIDTTRRLASAKQIISNADLQAGTKAAVVIFPKERIVSLRYRTS